MDESKLKKNLQSIQNFSVADKSNKDSNTVNPLFNQEGGGLRKKIPSNIMFNKLQQKSSIIQNKRSISKYRIEEKEVEEEEVKEIEERRLESINISNQGSVKEEEERGKENRREENENERRQPNPSSSPNKEEESRHKVFENNFVMSNNIKLLDPRMKGSLLARRHTISKDLFLKSSEDLSLSVDHTLKIPTEDISYSSYLLSQIFCCCYKETRDKYDYEFLRVSKLLNIRLFFHYLIDSYAEHFKLTNE
eukprot:CAMPEP_0170520538 /NCGR_PEP_ID=MMETSP0209-20121228/5829_1 /TAXON_ID=665100 ORGANISM="Litonotus pictus, Strain P1" /NCGR_SAMPLE_ID=MMETSP0209 /ASSEMBLY_ACC=CAM_ASM_000301 /LENGTH=249 /DNA_ID=CAMNT_0010806879 /DNA_START=1 /DNA_END=750 /DNA_ORIENTATION=+